MHSYKLKPLLELFQFITSILRNEQAIGAAFLVQRPLPTQFLT